MLEASDEYEVKLTVATSDREECIISASNISEPYTFQEKTYQLMVTF